MNRKTLWIALACFILPTLVRAIWFYPGFSIRPTISTPDFQSLSIPTPPVKAEQADSKIKEWGGVVVMDTLHGNQFKPPELDSLVQALNQRGARVEFDNGSPTLEMRLKYASAYVIISPSTVYTSDEMRWITAFVNNGGRLVVFTDATRGQITYDSYTGEASALPDSNIVNPILAPFGIAVEADYLYNLITNEGNFRNVFFDEFNEDELTFGLKRVAFYGTHSVKSDSGLPLFLGADQTLSSITDAGGGLSAGAVSGNGDVLALGDFTFLTPPYNNVTDNNRLIANIANFMLGGTRKPALANFPYLFNKSDVSILPTSEVQVSAEMVGALSRLQASLNTINVELKVVDEKPDEGNLLVLGTFVPSDDLAYFIDPFDLTMDADSEYITVPGFGDVGQSGNGLLLFQTDRKGNVIVLLADTVENLIVFLDTLSSGNLTGCVLQENIALCSIGVSDGDSDEEDVEEALTSEETYSDEATPTSEETPLDEATPTPVGTG
jgi:hypothetical protein